MLNMTKEQIQAVTVISWFRRSGELLFLIPNGEQPPSRFKTQLSNGNDGGAHLIIVRLMGLLVGKVFEKDEYYSTQSVSHYVKVGSRIGNTATHSPLPTTRKSIARKGN